MFFDRFFWISNVLYHVTYKQGQFDFFLYLCPCLYFNHSTLKQLRQWLFLSCTCLQCIFLKIFSMQDYIDWIFLHIPFIVLRCVPFSTTLSSTFTMKACWILPKLFFAFVEMMAWFLSLSEFMLFIIFVDLHMFNHPCISEIKPSSLWWMIFLMYICTLLVSY